MRHALIIVYSTMLIFMVAMDRETNTTSIEQKIIDECYKNGEFLLPTLHRTIKCEISKK